MLKKSKVTQTIEQDKDYIYIRKQPKKNNKNIIGVTITVIFHEDLASAERLGLPAPRACVLADLERLQRGFYFVRAMQLL